MHPGSFPGVPHGVLQEVHPQPPEMHRENEEPQGSNTLVKPLLGGYRSLIEISIDALHCMVKSKRIGGIGAGPEPKNYL